MKQCKSCENQYNQEKRETDYELLVEQIKEQEF